MKSRPKKPTAMAYAKYLYMESSCDGRVSTTTDRDIVASRVRAFIDGVNWEKRRARRTVGKSE